MLVNDLQVLKTKEKKKKKKSKKRKKKHKKKRDSSDSDSSDSGSDSDSNSEERKKKKLKKVGDSCGFDLISISVTSVCGGMNFRFATLNSIIGPAFLSFVV